MKSFIFYEFNIAANEIEIERCLRVAYSYTNMTWFWFHIMFLFIFISFDHLMIYNS